MKTQQSIKKIAVFLSLAFLITGLSLCNVFSKDQSKTLLKPLRDDLQLAWPPTGQGAIGSVKDGLLARSSNNEKARPTASIAKVITALAIMEKQPFKTGQEGHTYTVTGKDVAGHKAYLSRGGLLVPIRAGMKLTQHQALQRMLIASDNIMADILVERTFGSKEAYLSYARKMLKNMGLTRTNVADATGFSPATVSTPSDLVEVGIAALNNPVIAKIVARQEARVPVAGIIKNTNQLLGTPGIVGIKTGNTNEAGSCLLFATTYIGRDGKKGTIVGVIMGDKNRKSLYSHCRDLIASAKQGLGNGESPTVNSVPLLPKQRTGPSRNNKNQQ